MSRRRRTDNLQIITPGEAEAFSFLGLRFSPAATSAPSGATYNRIEDCVCTWTPAQEAPLFTGQALPGKTSPDSSGDARRALRRVVP